MKKRIASLIICILLCAVMFAGCSLVTLDLGRYLSAVVVSLTYEDKKIEITKEELLVAYNNYGSSLINNGASTEDAVKQTIDVLINRKVIIEEAKNLEESGQITLTNADKNKLFDDTLEALKNNLDEFIKDVKEKWNIKDPVFPGEESKEKGTVYTPYETKAEVVEIRKDEYVIKILENEEQKLEELRYDFETDEGRAKLMENYYVSVNDNSISKMGQKEYIKQLKKNEDGRHLSTDDESVFKREVDRIYKNLKENLYIEKYETYTKDGTGISNITVKQVLDRYKSMVLKSYMKYSTDSESYKKDMLESFDNVNCVVDDDYFFVSHILLKFNEAQAAEYKSLTADLEGGAITPLYYKERLDALYAQVRATERNEQGEKLDTSKSCDEVLFELNAALNNASTDIEKAEVFNKFIYRYNEDPGIMNAEYNYVIGTKESKMVESFTEASRKLHEQGSIGAISDGVVSENGVHIIFYAGKCDNVCKFKVSDPSSFVLTDKDIFTLTTTRLNICSNKTVFDKVYEDLVSDNYSIFQNMNINFLKEKYKIVKYEDNYKDLY